jgi:hypothetical protein
MRKGQTWRNKTRKIRDSIFPPGTPYGRRKPVRRMPQEWTGMTVANISAGCVHISPILRERIAEAHNAELAAERAKVKEKP